MRYGSVEWFGSVRILLHRKGDVRNCANYRTILLIPHLSKVLLKIFNSWRDGFHVREQAGLIPGEGAKE